MQPIDIVSLGAGVQSSTLVLMAAAGEITPMPEAAIFADTMAEPASVYSWLDQLEKLLPFPVHRVSKGNLSEDALKMRTSAKGIGYGVVQIPFFTQSPTGEIGKIRGRKCTSAYKIIPIVAKAREIVGRPRMADWRKRHRAALDSLANHKIAMRAFKKKTITRKPAFPFEAWRECQADPLVIQWIGISTDEITRAKESRDPWIVNRFPLVEMRKSRSQCVQWLTEHGHNTPPKSACRFCPFHDNKGWQKMKVEEPAEFVQVVQFQKDLQVARFNSSPDGSQLFLHRSCKPLEEIDFRSDTERGQGVLFEDDECEGGCFL